MPPAAKPPPPPPPTVQLPASADTQEQLAVTKETLTGSNAALANFLEKPSIRSGVSFLAGGSLILFVFLAWTIPAGHIHLGASWGGHDVDHDMRLTGIAEGVDGLAASCNAENDVALEKFLKELKDSWESANNDQGGRYGAIDRGLKAVRRVIRHRCMKKRVRRRADDDDLDEELDEETDES